jgi:hypothetical protein
LHRSVPRYVACRDPQESPSLANRTAYRTWGTFQRQQFNVRFGVKRTSFRHRGMSAIGPKQT